MTELNPPLMPTISAQIADWARATWRWTNPLAPKHKYLYNPHLWTIPTEAADSVLLFATLIAHSKLKPRIRVGCIATLYTYLLLQGHSDMSLFLAGMACAEYILVLAEDDKQLPIYEPKATKSLATTITQRIPKWLWLVSLYTSAHLLSFPNRGGASAFGFSTLAKFSPSSVQPATFWRTIGATLLLFTLAGGKFLQILFSNSYTVYLGKISFPLYLVHGPLNHMIGYRLVPFYWHFTGSDTFVSYETGVLLAGCTVAVILIWFADFLERVVDQPSVNFGRWLQKQWSV
ncbi:hypothetical protein J1614_010475 [Plenodomus biglobosus]|nr:hypothetical protein J1614_010475 [Plenodomus biglobosus]